MDKIKHKLLAMLSVAGVMLAIPQVFAEDEWPAQPPAEAPDNWGPVSINFEEIDYPWPIRFLESDPDQPAGEWR